MVSRSLDRSLLGKISSAGRCASHYFVLTILFAVSIPGWTFGDGADLDRSDVDQKYRDALFRLADDAEAAGEAAFAAEVRSWWIPRDPQRIYAFVPDSIPPADQPAKRTGVAAEWGARLTQLRKERAEQLFSLAKDSIDAEYAGQASMLLHEVLHEDPHHAEARRILGYREDEGSWTLGRSTFSSSTVYQRHKDFDWKPGEHYRVLTDHFVISTSHSLEQAEVIGETLEQLYTVWQQVFFDYWSSSEILARRFESDRTTRRSSVGRGSRKFNIILFRDRKEYIDSLAPNLPGVETTYGYYAPQREEAFFFVGDATARRTWLHETTHQMFQESIRSDDDVAFSTGIWAIEGIAAFMESLQEHRGYVTLGGFDTTWLQYARFRAMSQRYYIPLEQLSQLSRNDLQASESRPLLYSQSAGLSHYLMTGSTIESRRGFIEFLEATYRPGRHRPDALFEIVGRQPEEIDEAYREFLKVDRTELTNYLLCPEEVQELVLGFSDVDDESLKKLQKATKLRWLDLTATRVTDRSMKLVGSFSELDKLFLGGTRISDTGLQELSQLKSLVELDLVGVQVTSAGVAALEELDQLQSLRLNGTPVDDQVLPIVARMKSLTFVDLRDSRVTADGIQQLTKNRPELQIEFDE